MAAQTITKVPYVDNETVIGAANLNAIQDAVNDHASLIDGLDSGKVDKVAGKGLSTNDYNNDAQSKLNNLPSGAELDTSLGDKVDKRTSGTEVYTHNGSTQGGATLTETPTAGAVPMYGTGGVLKAGAPVAANDVVRKAELDEVEGTISDLNQQLIELTDLIPDTVQTIAYASDESVQSVTHTRNGTAVRTDVFTFGDDQITEVRTLATGESLTIVTVLSTLVTTITYSEGE